MSEITLIEPRFDLLHVDPVIAGYLEEIHLLVKKIIGNNKVTTENIVLITINIMKIVEKYPSLTGHQKKNLVIHTIKVIVKEQTEGEQEIALLTFIDLFLPEIIDNIISIDTKKIIIKSKGFFKKIFCCK